MYHIEDLEQLRLALQKIYTGNNPPNVVIETGTYLGGGSTKALITAYELNKLPKDFHIHTIEGNKECFEKARETLRPWPYVTVHHGATLNVDMMREFIERDRTLLNPPKWVRVDVPEGSSGLPFYLNEVSDERINTRNDDLLIRLMEEFEDQEKLFFLDSASGVGYLEFQTVVNYMGDEHYYLGLGDIDHIRHYPSWKDIMSDKGSWKILFNDGRTGLVEHIS